MTALIAPIEDDRRSAGGSSGPHRFEGLRTASKWAFRKLTDARRGTTSSTGAVSRYSKLPRMFGAEES